MKKAKLEIIVAVIIAALAASCGGSKESGDKKLPYLGRHEYSETDTVYHTVADFRFVDQDSNWVSNDTFKDKIYVADFFFTSCPTICPKMDAQMLRIYNTIQDVSDVALVSYTIDPKHDSVNVLKEFALKLGVENTDKWHFLTGDKDAIYQLGQTSYMVSASEDPSEPGGYIHSGAFILVDKDRHIRGVYDGTKPEDVDVLMKDIEVLRKES
ncbi:SCO family protein [Fulvivirga sediminis]|uniref:SCO family protein n=1 Tax=Fulvivirga sediminis TaxID=2803949 RepID=A0A937F2F0_9BACT|nr:SCO family protein [Fulvivirga sediminis]MBL3655052.1 SCO family protein [Fulvivirga sediminis]